MIKNAKQYNVSKSKLKDLCQSLKDCKRASFPDSNIYMAMRASIISLINDITDEIRAYKQSVEANGV